MKTPRSLASVACLVCGSHDLPQRVTFSLTLLALRKLIKKGTGEPGYRFTVTMLPPRVAGVLSSDHSVSSTVRTPFVILATF